MLKLLEESLGNTLQDRDLGKNSLNRNPTAQELAPRVNRWNHMKFERVCTAKETIIRTHTQSQSERTSLPAVLQAEG